MPRRRSLPGNLPAGPIPIDSGTVELEPDPDRPDGVMIYVNGVESSYLDLAQPRHLEFEYMQQMRLALASRLADEPRCRILHLGGAGCAFARAIAAEHPGARQVVVEVDARLSELAREWFDLPRAPALRIRVGEARREVGGLRPSRWEAIIRDAFSGAQVPPHLTTVEFLRQISSALTPDGLYLGNLVDSPPLVQARREVATAKAVFDSVSLAVEPPIIKGRRYGNLVVLAGATPPEPDLARRLLALPAPVRLVQGGELDDFVGTHAPLTDAEIGHEPSPTALWPAP